MRRFHLLFAIACVALLLFLGTGYAVWVFFLRTTVAPPAWANDYDVSARAPDTIAPGTVVDRTAPQGWSHLVIKSLPRVRASEVPRVPNNLVFGRAGTVRMVSWMFTAFAVDVVQEQQGVHSRYRLRAIGLGLGTNIKGRDVIITKETARQHGAEMDWIKDEVIETGYRIQKQAIIPLMGVSMGILDTPVTIRCKTKHRPIRYRYALLVDSQTGKLDVLLWQLPGETTDCCEIANAVLLKPDCIDEAELVPDLSEFNRVGIPNENAFAVDNLPPHRLQIAFPAELLPLVAKTKFTPEEAATLEAGLRKMLP